MAPGAGWRLPAAPAPLWWLAPAGWLAAGPVCSGQQSLRSSGTPGSMWAGHVAACALREPVCPHASPQHCQCAVLVLQQAQQREPGHCAAGVLPRGARSTPVPPVPAAGPMPCRACGVHAHAAELQWQWLGWPQWPWAVWARAAGVARWPLGAARGRLCCQCRLTWAASTAHTLPAALQSWPGPPLAAAAACCACTSAPSGSRALLLLRALALRRHRDWGCVAQRSAREQCGGAVWEVLGIQYGRV